MFGVKNLQESKERAALCELVPQNLLFFHWLRGCRIKLLRFKDLLFTRAVRHRVLKWADDMVQVAKNEMWASEVCFACLTWLYGLFVRTLISRTNAYAGCDRPTLNFIERFRLGSVRSASKWNITKLNSKCTQMNYEMNCITMQTCTQNLISRILTTWGQNQKEAAQLRRRDEKLNADSEATSPRVSRSMIVYVQIMSNCLAWMWT